jgi:methyl-accepting chemotaxis protein
MSGVGGEPNDAAAIAQRIADGDLASDLDTGDTDTETDRYSVVHAMKAIREQLAGTLSRISGGTATISSASGQRGTSPSKAGPSSRTWRHDGLDQRLVEKIVDVIDGIAFQTNILALAPTNAWSAKPA